MIPILRSTTVAALATSSSLSTYTSSIVKLTTIRRRSSSFLLSPKILSLSSTRMTPSTTATSLLSTTSSAGGDSATTEVSKENGPAQQLLAHRLDGLDAPTVWQEFSPLAVQHAAVNLGQGFPDWEPPAFVKQCMYESIFSDHMNQYARSYAHMPLATVLATEYSERFQRTIDPATMIASAVGCTNVLYCALQGLLNPGDEVICFEPSFDIYTSQVRMAGGKPVFVPFRDPTASENGSKRSKSSGLQYANEKFVLDMEELEAAITPRTKVIILNTPHNPTGKIFTRDELTAIAAVVKKYPQITIVSDEVYEHIIFVEDDGTTLEHISIGSLPEIFGQTLTLSSSGKTFSCTGWKVGWAVGPAHLVKAVTAVQQWVNYSAPTPNQHAIAKALQIARTPYKPDDDEKTYKSYYEWLAADYQRKRGLLISALQAAGMTPIIPHGGFFIMADTSSITFPYDEQYKYQITDAMPKLQELVDGSSTKTYMPRDWALSRWLTEVVGVTAIPPSAFYCLDRAPLAKNYLRFAFCKGDTTILQARERFEKYFTTQKATTDANALN